MIHKYVLMPILLAAILASSSCAHSSRITSDPEGADVYINNIFIGQTPTNYRSRSSLPEPAYVRIEKKGFKPIKNAVIEKALRADVSLLLLLPGIIPYFFSARFEDNYVFSMKPLKPTETPKK
jgi:hypothetical protein